MTKINRGLNLATLGMIAATVAVGVWSWATQNHVPSPASFVDQNTPPKRSAEIARTAEQTSKETRAALLASDTWTRALRAGCQPPATPPPVPPAPPVAVPANVVPPPIVASRDLGLRLVGTVMESGNSMAIAVDSTGKLDFRKEGEAFELNPPGIRVDKILEDAVQISFEGQASTWQLGQALQLAQPSVAPTPSPVPVVHAAVPVVNSAVPVVNSVSGENSAASATDANQPTAPRRKMTLEEELDLMNGASPTDSF